MRGLYGVWRTGDKSLHPSSNFLQAGHKYLFSDTAYTWEDAMAECQLYGGWLVSIGSQREQNCLIRHGLSLGKDTWHWTDGNIYLLPCEIDIIFCDFLTGVMRNAVWVHAVNDLDVEWFSPYLGCHWGDGNYFGTYGGDAYVLGLFQDINLVGRWCDDYSAIPDRVHPIICESVI